MDDRELFAMMTRIAEACFDGHVTIMRFTTNWRVAFGPQNLCKNGWITDDCTPSEEWSSPCNEGVLNMASGATLEEAFMNAIRKAISQREAIRLQVGAAMQSGMRAPAIVAP